jgi:soluble lytic murein transglycosylase-like protein
MFRFVLAIALSVASAAALADIYARIDAQGVAQFSSQPAEGFELYMKTTSNAAPADSMAGRAWDADTPYAKVVRAAARTANVQAELIHAVINIESNYQPAARSPAGAVGLMQLMPDTAKRYNVSNRLDPKQNILGGARYLRDLLDLFEDNLSLALAAYNAGENAVIKHGNRVPPYRETAAYVPKVMALYRKLTGASGAGTSDWRTKLPRARVSMSFAPPRSSE